MKCDELEDEYLWTNNVKTPSTIMVRAYNADDVDKAIAELKQKLEDAKASHYAEMVDAGMENRRLRRALYIVLARLFCCMRELAARNALYDDECKWDNFKTTCLKKAEEYK